MKQLLRQISQPISADIGKFDEAFQDSLISDIRLINSIIRYISKRKGKQIRPRLTLLSARMCGEPNQGTFKAAALMEILHIATLVHDDVVDDADIRRGWPTVRKIWKNKLAILVGDYMFSVALTNIIHLENFDALRVLSSTAERLSQGEIMQIEKAIRREMTEKDYYRMVTDKTASLISAACELGAISVTDDLKKRRAMQQYGEKLGIAFQIKDDLFDILGSVASTGKSSGFDVKKDMLTLPFIHTLNRLKGPARARLQWQIRRLARRDELAKIKQIVEENGGIRYAQDAIRNVSADAEAALKDFPESACKSALLSILDFNMNREF